MANSEAALAYQQSVAAFYTLRTQQTLSGASGDAPRKAEHLRHERWALRLIPEEAAALYRELTDVIARYRRDAPETAASPPEGAERVAVITQILPELDAPAVSPLPSGPQEEEGSPTL